MDIIEEDENDTDLSCTPPELACVARETTLNLLPEKSRHKYEKQYELFTAWCKSKKVGRYSENVLMAYFSEKAKTLKSSTLWSVYSMPRSVLSVKNDVDISQYKKLIAYLKRQGVGYKSKKSKIFTKEEVLKFLIEAPDEVYLLKKVILIMGLFGACRRDELVKMTVNDIEDKGSLLVIKIPDTKTNHSRIFTVNNSEEGMVDFLSLYRRYVALRPLDKDTPSRLFLRYLKGKCTRQVVGMNIIGNTPSEIAQYLKLPDFKMYTGHSFRRTSATFLVNGGGNLMQLKRHGGWKSSAVAEAYVEENINNKIETADKIMGGGKTVVHMESSKSTENVFPEHDGLVFKNPVNCTFNVNIVNNINK